jgi:hypothetical protein
MAVAGVISATVLPMGPTARVVRADKPPPCPGDQVCDYDELNFQESGRNVLIYPNTRVPSLGLHAYSRGGY